MTKVRRYILNGKFLRAHSTGVHRVAIELVNALADMQAADDPLVAGMNFELWYPFDGAENAAAVRMRKRMVGPLTGIPWEQLTLPLRKGDATLIDLCNIGPPLARDAVTMVHDVQVHISPASYSRPFRLWYHFIQPAFGRRHRAILTVSDFSAEEIKRVGLAPGKPVFTIHNGIDHSVAVASEPAILSRLAIENTPYVLGLATTQAHKNIGVLLDAFRDPRLADTLLVLFGSTNAEAFQAAGMPLPANVRLAGRVSDGELRALMEAARCLAFPSTTEGFGLPPLEAMLVGCPAVVAPCGALPEVCSEAAVYADPDDPAAWADAVRAMVVDPEHRQRHSESGLVRAKDFTWHRAAVQLVNALNAVA